ncbi:MAG: hypothetical protein MJE77_31080 [Proteobacteria bacterium]|nr:hypothetical protein [Pseudomonadota bacterium]
MLENVALGQSRFMTPGVAPDPRGVLLGRYGMLSFATLEGVVSWLRLYSAESSIDELLSGMEIHQAITPLRSREMLVRIPATSSYTLDRAGRCAKFVGGTIYTGTSKHFVKYRDDRSPYGYDAVGIHALPHNADIMVHGEDFTQTYHKERLIPFHKLLFRLSLRRVPGGDKLRPDDRSELVLVVARGLGEGVIRYLWRNRVPAEVALVKPRGQSAFGDATDASYLLFRVGKLPERILDLCMATPGIEVFRLNTPQAAVQVGFTHLIDLSSCASVFSEQSFYVFWGYSAHEGRIDRVDVLDGPVEFSGIENLTRIRLDVEKPRARENLEGSDVDQVGVPIRLAPSLVPPRHVIATLIPLAQGPMLKRLVYFLPRSSLRGHQVVVTDRGILVVAAENIDVIPLGQILCELAAGLLVPMGMDLVPRVAPDVLARALGHGAGLLTVFPHRGNPFQVSRAALAPLERRALAKIEVDRASVVDTHMDSQGQPTLVNEPVGRFALWGYPNPRSKS